MNSGMGTVVYGLLCAACYVYVRCSGGRGVPGVCQTGHGHGVPDWSWPWCTGLVMAMPYCTGPAMPYRTGPAMPYRTGPAMPYWVWPCRTGSGHGVWIWPWSMDLGPGAWTSVINGAASWMGLWRAVIRLDSSVIEVIEVC